MNHDECRLSTDTIYSPRFASLVLVTGALAGIAAGLLMKLLRAVQHASFGYQSGNFLAGVEHMPAGRRIPVLLMAGVLAGCTLYLLGRVSKLRKDLDTAVRAVLSIVIVGMGASLGREGALKHAGSLIAGRLSDWSRCTADQKRLLIAFGTGAGMAAAYNVPFGATLFTLEVLIGTITLPTAVAALAASLTATALSWLFLPDEPSYIVHAGATTLWMIPWAVIAAPVIGMGSVAFVRLLRWAIAHQPKGWFVMAAPILALGSVGALAIPYPQLLGNGRNVVQMAYLDQMGMSLIVILLVLRPLATALCLGSGAPGGLFTPTMTLGALLGAFLSKGLALVTNGDYTASCAIIGSGALLAAASQGPISSVVFVWELTHHLDGLMVPLSIATVGATIVARALDRDTIYTIREQS